MHSRKEGLNLGPTRRSMLGLPSSHKAISIEGRVHVWTLGSPRDRPWIKCNNAKGNHCIFFPSQVLFPNAGSRPIVVGQHVGARFQFSFVLFVRPYFSGLSAFRSASPSLELRSPTPQRPAFLTPPPLPHTDCEVQLALRTLQPPGLSVLGVYANRVRLSSVLKLCRRNAFPCLLPSALSRSRLEQPRQGPSWGAPRRNSFRSNTYRRNVHSKELKAISSRYLQYKTNGREGGRNC
jgi:hypothetical protein